MDSVKRMRAVSRTLPLHLTGTFLVLAATLVASKLTGHRKSEPLVQPLDSISWNISRFVGREKPYDDDIVNDLRTTSYLSRTYQKPGIQADLFIGFYDQQRAGESMHSPKNCLPGSGWEIWDYGSAQISVDGSMVTVNRYSVSRDTQRMLVLYWYQSKGRIIASEYRAKVLLVRDALFFNSTAGSIVRIIVPDQSGALDEARALAAELIPQVQRSFGG
jgi:EpsI family protein